MRKLFTVLFAAAPMVLGAVPAFAQAAPGLAQPEAPKEEKKVCKRITETGSLARVTKVCLTRAEWERSARGHQGYAQDMQDSLRGKPGGQ